MPTPRFDVPSPRSQLETIPSEASEAPGPNISDQISRVLESLNDMNTARGEDNRQLRQAIDGVTNMLTDLLDLAQRSQPRTPGVQQAPQASQPPQLSQEAQTSVPESFPPDAPPPVPHKDRSVGGSSIISSERSLPSGPRELPPRPATVPHRVAIPLTPPPMFSRIPSPDSLVETMSFLPSHHSDDLSLLESESYAPRPYSPSWPSESSSTSSLMSSPPSSISEIHSADAYPPVSDVSTESGLSISVTLPPESPTPSSASSGTARPVPPINIAQLRDQLNGIVQQLTAVQDDQDTAHRILDELRDRPAQDLRECCEKIQRLEETIQRLLERADRPTAPPPREPDRSASPSVASEDSELRRLLEALGRGSRESLLPIREPAPIRAGPSFAERLEEMMTSGPLPTRPPVQPPLPITPLAYRAGRRVTRPRSVSPVFEADIPMRAATVPIAEPMRPPQPPYLPRTRRNGRRPLVVPPPSSENETLYTPSVMRPPEGMPYDRPESIGPDFLRELQNNRRMRTGSVAYRHPPPVITLL